MMVNALVEIRTPMREVLIDPLYYIIRLKIAGGIVIVVKMAMGQQTMMLI
jgi:hypothetical protein